MSSTIVASTTKPASRQLSNFLLTLPFILFFLVQLYHHQLWRDELNVWGIVRASPTLGMLAHYIHYEGHPGLWYYLLWFPARFFVHPAAMKVVEAFIGIAIYLLIGMASPFSRLEKILLFLSYYISFEYTVLSRTYGLCLVFALAYVCARTRRPQAVALCAVLLGLLANTDIFGVLLSGALIVEYSWDCFLSKRSTKPQVRLWSIYAMLLILCYLSVRPAKDITWESSGRLFSHYSDTYHLQRSVLSSVGLPWFPLSAQFPHKFWNPNVVLHPGFFTLISLASLAALYIIFRKSPQLLTLIALTLVASILFSHLIFLGFMRHFGIVFLAFLLAYWIKRYRSAVVSKTAVFLVAISAVCGLVAAVGQWMHPFSNSANAARWLTAHHLEKEPLAGFLDTTSVGVAEQLDRSIYFPQCNCSDTFMLFSSRRDDSDPAHLAAHLKRTDADLHTDHYILILALPLTSQQSAEIVADHQQIVELAAFNDAEEPGENFYLYRISRTA